MPKTIDLTSTGLRRSFGVDNKTKQKYGLFVKFSLSVVGAYEVDLKTYL